MTATLTASRPIRQLPLELANQIAAGEVVERPASVVKELIENSLDAGATRVEIGLSRGGLQEIIIRDNGWGIPKEQLPLAISRHATSKIASLEELENIHSLGFRGEALASIGSVSRMQLQSCCQNTTEAWQIDCGSDDLTVQAISHPAGTSIIVQDLFYNTPARRKFMRTEKTEFRHVDEVVRRMALSHFNVGFTFKHNDRTVYQFAPADKEVSRGRRVGKLCGKAFMDNAVQLDFNSRGFRLWGWVTGAGFSRSQNDLQHFYVNGRIIRDRLITHAIRQVYQQWIHPGRHAAYLLHFEIDPSAVDVNVHPTKHEVRFREARMVHDFIHRSLKDALSGSSVSESPKHNWSGNWQAQAYEHQSYSPQKISEPSENIALPLGQAKALLHDRFIVAENGHGLVLVDAREAQQQLIYQKLSESFAGEGISRRPLLIPKSLPIKPEQVGPIEQSHAVLKKLGFEMNCNGPESVMLRMIPVVIAGADMELVLPVLLESLPGQSETNEMLKAIARVAAQTQGIESSPEAFNRLLREIEALDDKTLWRCFNAHELHKLIHQA